jgi:predicted ribonuclease YlaK
LLLEPAPRLRPPDADEEILAVCSELPQLTGRQVTLVTGDTAMRLRAAAIGLRAVELPADHRRPLGESDT